MTKSLLTQPLREMYMHENPKGADEPILPGLRTLTSDWQALETRLADVLAALEEDQFLIISAKRGWAYVQFAAQGAFGLRAESVSNNYLDDAHALGATQIQALQELGWSAPTGTLNEATPARQPEGSSNFFKDFPRPIPGADVARLAVRTLNEVYALPHPGYLQYRAFDASNRDILLPSLGLMRVPAAEPQKQRPPETVEQVRQLARDALRRASGDSDLDFDDENLLAMRYGSAVVFVRVHREPFCVSVTAPVLTKMEPNELLLTRLNELNSKVRFARLFSFEGTVHARMEIFASPFVAGHLINACALLGTLADKIDDMLQKEFGGRTAFGEFSSKHRVH